MTFKPIGTNVLIEKIDIQPANGILVPDNAELNDYSVFRVVDVGDGVLLTSGAWKPLPIKPGDYVHPSATAVGNLFRLPKNLCDDRELAVLDIKHILGHWEGDLPKPRLTPKIHAAQALATARN